MPVYSFKFTIAEHNINGNILCKELAIEKFTIISYIVLLVIEKALLMPSADLL